MTSVYDANGRLHPVTVIAAGDNVLMRRVPAENDGYSAIKVGFGAQKESRVTKALLGEFKKAGAEPKKLMKEFRLEADAASLQHRDDFKAGLVAEEALTGPLAGHVERAARTSSEAAAPFF